MADSLEDIKFRDHFEDYINATEEERERAERRRDYRDLKQWTQNEVENLSKRDQAPVVFDYFSKKVDGINGIEVQRRTDPKALPVHPKNQKAAEVITDGLRYVESKESFDHTATEVYEDKIVEGVGGAIVPVSKKGNEFAINIYRIPWDRLYYDPHSREKDFSDSSYFGITLWMDEDDAVALNPDREEEIRNLALTAKFSDETFEDRPEDWVSSDRKRVRVNQEYFLFKGIWHEVFYSGDLIIIDPKESPYLDENDEPENPIELECDYVSRENGRWGYMQRMMDPQDEINHRRSKALHLLSSKTVIADKGAFGQTPINKVLNELRKGFSFITKVKGSEVSIDNQQDLGQSQLAFYQDALQAMDSMGVNPELNGQTDAAISGRAFLARQQGGMTELTPSLSIHDEWKERIYTQVWHRMKQFWTEEKWMRVSDEEGAYRFIGLNVPIRRIEKELEDRTGMGIEKLYDKDREAVEAFVAAEIQKNPLMGEVVETRNDVKTLEMDIKIVPVTETAVLQQEQFETLANLASARIDPLMFETLLSLSSIKGKEEILDKLKPKDNPELAAAQQQAAQLEMADKMAEIQGKQADNEKTSAETQKVLSEIPLNEAKTKDEMASAIERIGKTSGII